jgi:protein-L-isoaspartate O-methyltransferase
MSDPLARDGAARHFDAKYRDDPDPWGYLTSAYEREKYARTLLACGPAPLGRVLELGAAAGVFSATLAARCEHLTTIDAAPTAVALARRRLAGLDHVRVVDGDVPDDLPAGERFDVVVASEILYYLQDDAFARTLERLPALLAPGGRLVAVHWTGSAEDLARSAVATHEALAATGLRPLGLPAPDGPREYLLDAYGA